MNDCPTHLHKSTETNWLPTYTRSSVKVKLVQQANDTRRRLHLTSREVKSCPYCRMGEGYQRKLKIRDATSTLPLSTATRQVSKKKKIFFTSLMQFPLQGVVKGGGCVQSGRERTIAAALLSHRLGLRFAAWCQEKECSLSISKNRASTRKPPPLQYPPALKHEVWSSLRAGRRTCFEDAKFRHVTLSLSLRRLYCPRLSGAWCRLTRRAVGCLFKEVERA